MTPREKYLSTMHFTEGAEAPFTPFFMPTDDLIKRWIEEGMGTEDGWQDFDFDFISIERVRINYGFCPPFEEVILDEDERFKVYRDSSGITLREFKEGHTSKMPQFLDFPLKNRDDWEMLKKRLNPDISNRFPENWDELRKNYKKRDFPLQLGQYPYGFFGTLRDFMGLERLLLAFYDQPDLVREILGYLTDFWITLWGKITSDVSVDVAHLWEDMCYRNGPLISPDLFREFILPCYKKITAFARSSGIDIITVDTDGNCWKLIPLFLEGGVTGLWPFEVRAGMDVVEVRKQYPELQICGGINASALSHGKKEMDRELEKMKAMLKKGGYIPFFDNDLLPDIPWKNYRYFITRQREIVRSKTYSIFSGYP